MNADSRVCRVLGVEPDPENRRLKIRREVFKILDQETRSGANVGNQTDLEKKVREKLRFLASS